MRAEVLIQRSLWRIVKVNHSEADVAYYLERHDGQDAMGQVRWRSLTSNQDYYLVTSDMTIFLSRLLSDPGIRSFIDYEVFRHDPT